jgi:hypothetical protein
LPRLRKFILPFFGLDFGILNCSAGGSADSAIFSKHINSDATFFGATLPLSFRLLHPGIHAVANVLELRSHRHAKLLKILI